MKTQIRVVVAMSGGVDSSVAALLLKKQGFEVIGISYHVYNRRNLVDNTFGSCCSLDDIRDARGVCQLLHIPHYVLNFEKIFKKEVIDYFADEYLKGRTPNPCILCNDRIKFVHLLNKAQELRADFLATGHYVRKCFDKKTQKFYLKKARDKNKDQSYFLFSLRQEQLRYILFPLGDLTKAEVRAIAQQHRLPVADKKESQEICFVPHRSYVDFLKKYRGIEDQPGDIVNLEGQVLGKHQGIFNYTLGQRKGLGIAWRYPLYVTKLDLKKNQVVIGDNEDLACFKLIAKGLNWIEGDFPTGKISAKIRYRHRDIEASLLKDGENRLRVEFKSPQRAITPGQAVVFYQGEKILGGGWIEKGLH